MSEENWTHVECLIRGYHRWVVHSGSPVEDEYITVDLYCEDCGATASCSHNHRVNLPPVKEMKE